MWIYLNNRFVTKEDAMISVFDHGFLYGDGIFETMRAYQRCILQLSEHLDRLERSASRIQLQLPVTRVQLIECLRQSLEKNKLQDAYVRLMVTRGVGEIGLSPTLCPIPTLIIFTKPFEPYPEQLYTEGVSVTIVNTRRNLAEALPPQVKSLNFLNNILAKIEATAAGAYEGLMLNVHEELTEGTISNVFIVQDGTLRTPALECGILDGITRGIVLQLARELHIPTEEGRLRMTDLYQAHECFLTNTTQEILPVTRIDGRLIGNGTPGEMTKRLHTLFRSRLGSFLENL